MKKIVIILIIIMLVTGITSTALFATIGVNGLRNFGNWEIKSNTGYFDADDINNTAEKFGESMEKFGESMGDVGEELGESMSDIGEELEESMEDITEDYDGSWHWGINWFGFGWREHIVNEQHDLNINQPCNLEIDGCFEDVTLYESENDKSSVVMHGKYYGRNLSPKLQIENNNGQLHINVRYNTKSINTGSSKVKLDVYLAKEYIESIDINVVSGDVQLSGWSNLEKFKIKTVSGDINIEGVEAEDFDLGTVSGDITATEIETNDFYGKTTSGRINVTGSNINNCEAKSVSGKLEFDNVSGKSTLGTTSGDINIEYSEITDEQYIKSVSGDVEVIISDMQNCELEFDTVSGDISTNNLTLNNVNQGKKSLNATVNEGGEVIKIKTTSGDINIKED